MEHKHCLFDCRKTVAFFLSSTLTEMVFLDEKLDTADFITSLQSDKDNYWNNYIML